MAELPINEKTIDRLINAAKQHGEDSEPDHEVGDLQDYLRAAWRIMSPAQRLQFMKDDAVRDVAEIETTRIFEEIDEALESIPHNSIAEMEQHTEAVSLLSEADTYLREIRAENLDGSEPALGKLLDQTTNYWVKIGVFQSAQVNEEDQGDTPSLGA